MSKYTRKNSKYRKLAKKIGLSLLLVFLLISVCYAARARYALLHPTGEYGEIGESPVGTGLVITEEPAADNSSSINPEDVPEYSGTPTYVINGNKPEFTEDEYEKAGAAFIELSDLDMLGRCGPCTASLGKEMLDSAGERRDISQYHPSGWNQASYPGIIEAEGSWLYHRSHLIAHMFAGADPEIDGPKNLITGTEYCNEKGMLPYVEKAVQNWLLMKANGGRVLYRVTPVFSGLELVARGVHIEAADVESKGQKFHINVYCYNVEPGIKIDYLTGESRAE